MVILYEGYFYKNIYGIIILSCKQVQDIEKKYGSIIITDIKI